MSELALTLLRMGFLALLWIFIISILRLMRRDLNRVDSKYTSKNAVSPNDLSKSSSRVRRVFVSEDDSEREFELLDGMTFGRANDSTVRISDDYASSRHAVLHLDKGNWVFEDLGSTNGTWQDRKRISGSIKIRRGTVLKIGNTELRFEK